MGKHREIEEARRILEDTMRLARKLYGRRWLDALEELEDMYEGDPFEVLEHLRREAEKRGIK
ncbi:MAG: hypothetical protein F7C81_04425 [Desulfurococcales archaeon]|nr:hypothetical protein [Desulfurococcales archaeon]MEB3779612.1 hypothetical protein [Desulfurococcales archaeon]